jgi:thiamine phosphate synthase YjbQ (UPF0047 family)
MRESIVFFCEFDGPRSERRVVCTIFADSGGPA